jgi:hypothetical protein
LRPYRSRLDRGGHGKLIPHSTLEASRALGILSKSFFLDYLKGLLQGGAEQQIGIAADVFEGEALQRAFATTSQEALNTPIILTDRISDRALALMATSSNPDFPRLILVNTRFKVDPEVLAHTMAEEIVHAQQALDGVDVEAQKASYAYADRPYEQEAKAKATLIVGYEPNAFDVLKRRVVPSGPLFDDPLA